MYPHTQHPRTRRDERGSEMTDVQKFGEEFQRASKDGFDASVRSLGEVNKGLQVIAATVTDYSKVSVRQESL